MSDKEKTRKQLRETSGDVDKPICLWDAPIVGELRALLESKPMPKE